MPVGDTLPARPSTKRWHVIAEIDIARLVLRHRRLRQLCDRIESCADDLPGLPAKPVIAVLCRQLGSDLTADLAQDQDFLRSNFGFDHAAPLDRALLGEVGDRHASGSDHALEVVAALSDGEADLCPPSSETMGFIFRSFFESCRDALAFEELAILQLGRLRLTATARAMLVDCLIDARR